MGSKGSQTTTQNTTTAPDPQAMAAYQQLLQRAQGVASTPYQGYSGELVAPVNQQQNLGISNINANAGYASPYISQAIGQTAANSSPLTAAQIQQYMSPYTQNVVDTTQAQFNNQNTQALNQVKGNAIAQGALGGNREGIAEAQTLGQLQMAQAPTIAGLYNSGYGQAVNTAMGQKQLGLQGAGMIGNMGIAGQNAALQGANAQLGAGSLQQGTQQALDQALLQQYQQQQAFPYQQAQWLAGLTTGVGSQMGGTSSGQTTTPAPGLGQQLLGGLTSGVGLLGSSGAFGSAGWLAPLMSFSDEKLKEGVEDIGRTHDGQRIVKFRYKGHPQTHIGFLAQDVEKHKPEAVGVAAGYKTVDYDKATEDAVKRAAGGVVGFAGGGTADGVSAMPWGGGLSWIPSANIAHGAGAPPARAPAPAGQQQSTSDQMKQVGSLAKDLQGTFNGPSYGGGNVFTDEYGGSSANPLAGLDAGDYGAGFARGGVAGFADGGSPSFDDRFNAAFPNSSSNDGVINPDEPYRMPPPEAVQAWREGATNPALAADVSPSGGKPQGVALPPEVTAGKSSVDDSSDGVTPLSYSARDRGIALNPAGTTTAMPTGDYSGGEGVATKPGFNWGGDNKLWPSLISAGFGMMASRSPTLGGAIGEGGLAGVRAFNQQTQAEYEARQAAAEMAMKREQLNMAEHKQAREEATAAMIPDGRGGYKINPTYIEQKRQEAEATQKDFKPTLGVIDELPSGRKIMGWSDPNTKKVYDVQGRPYDPNNAESVRRASEAQEQPQNQAATHESDPQAAPGTEASRNTKHLAELAKQEPGYAQLIKKAADYELDPAKVVSMRSDLRQRFVADVLRYDPNYNPQDVALRFQAQKSFLPGTKNGDTVTAFNTAISHLDTLKQLYTALNNGDVQLINKAKNTFMQQFGYAAPNDVAALASIIGGEVVKATVGAQNALGDREEVRQSISRDLSHEQADSVIDKYQKLMAGQLRARQFAYEQGTGLHNFEEKFLLPRSREILHEVNQAESGIGAKPAGKAPPQGAVEMLKKNPALAPQFDAKYGPGTSKQILGQ